MLCLSVSCLFFKSYNLQYRQQHIFWDLMFPKSHNLESQLHKKLMLQIFNQKGNLMLCNLGREVESWNTPQIFWRQCPHPTPTIFKASWIWGTLAYSWKSMPKKPSKKLLHKAFAGFLYLLDMIQWKRRFDPGLAARWYSLVQSPNFFNV